MQSALSVGAQASVAQRIQDLREERLYRTRREEPLGRGPLRAHAVPSACDPAQNPRFKGFGLATKRDESAASVFNHQAAATAASGVRGEAIEAARHAVGVNTARINQPGRRARNTTFDGSTIDPNTATFGAQTSRGRDTARDCIFGSSGDKSSRSRSTQVIPLSVAQHRVMSDSATGGAGVGMAPIQRLGREVFVGSPELQGSHCRCATARSKSEAASTSLAAAQRSQSAGATRPTRQSARQAGQRDSVAAIFASAAAARADESRVQQQRSSHKSVAVNEHVTFGAPSVRVQQRPLERVENASVADGRAFADNQLSARDLLFDRASPARSQPALTAKQLRRDEVMTLVARSKARAGSAAFEAVDVDKAWTKAANPTTNTCNLTSFLEACRTVDS
jgi:hypothetical protein